MTWKPPPLTPLAVEEMPTVGRITSSEASLPGAHELESDSAFWALHDEVQVLGKGSYGTVKLARVKSNNNLVAVKAVSKGASPPIDGIDERKEAMALLMLRHNVNANTAPARIGGRKARAPSRRSIFQLKEAMSGMADAPDSSASDSSGFSPRTVVQALPPQPVAKKGVSLGAVPHSWRHRSSRSLNSMDLWQLRSALFGSSGPANERSKNECPVTEAEVKPSRSPAAAHMLHDYKVEEESSGQIDWASMAEVPADETNCNTVRLLDIYESPGTLFLVMRAELGGDLATRLAELGGHCSEEEARIHCSALLRAIAEMHEQGIVHRDIKPANVLLSDHGEGRLGDFGLAERLPSPPLPPLLTTVCGTHNNMAPEMILCGHGESPGYDTRADMWQLGLVLFEMLFGYHPFARNTEIDTLAAILAANYSIPSDTHVSEYAIDLVRSLLVTDPDLRPTADDCLRHPWIEADGLGIN